MMEIVLLRTGQQRQMVPGMDMQRVGDGHREPQPRDGDVATGGPHAYPDRQKIADQVFQRMRIHGSDGDRSSPLVVLLVDEFVDSPMVQQAVTVVEAELFDHYAHGQLPQRCGEGGQLSDHFRGLWGDYVVQAEKHREAGENLVEHDLADDASESTVVYGLVGSRLDLVAPQERRLVGYVE